ncbi:hypothetical protein JY96_10275 [Aquabacterium sp. NJ1]|nr:hypothetical protein JY96_10275 [Aquabacterium sp. NJ1]
MYSGMYDAAYADIKVVARFLMRIVFSKSLRKRHRRTRILQLIQRRKPKFADNLPNEVPFKVSRVHQG